MGDGDHSSHTHYNCKEIQTMIMLVVMMICIWTKKRGWYHNDPSDNKKYENTKQIQNNFNDVDGENGFARYQLDSTTITTHIWKVTMMIGMKKIKWIGKKTQWVQI